MARCSFTKRLSKKKVPQEDDKKKFGLTGMAF
jgi:hypothetical protein